MSNTIEKAFVLMKRHKITQTQVAQKYGCTREHINRIINGSVVVSKDIQNKILTAIDEIIAERK